MEVAQDRSQHADRIDFGDGQPDGAGDVAGLRRCRVGEPLRRRLDRRAPRPAAPRPRGQRIARLAALEQRQTDRRLERRHPPRRGRLADAQRAGRRRACCRSRRRRGNERRSFQSSIAVSSAPTHRRAHAALLQNARATSLLSGFNLQRYISPHAAAMEGAAFRETDNADLLSRRGACRGPSRRARRGSAARAGHTFAGRGTPGPQPGECGRRRAASTRASCAPRVRFVVKHRRSIRSASARRGNAPTQPSHGLLRHGQSQSARQARRWWLCGSLRTPIGYGRCVERIASRVALASAHSPRSSSANTSSHQV